MANYGILDKFWIVLEVAKLVNKIDVMKRLIRIDRYAIGITI